MVIEIGRGVYQKSLLSLENFKKYLTPRKLQYPKFYLITPVIVFSVTNDQALMAAQFPAFSLNQQFAPIENESNFGA